MQAFALTAPGSTQFLSPPLPRPGILSPSVSSFRSPFLLTHDRDRGGSHYLFIFQVSFPRDPRAFTCSSVCPFHAFSTSNCSWMRIIRFTLGFLLNVVDVAFPSPKLSSFHAGPTQVLLRLSASSMNRRDYWITQGLYPGMKNVLAGAFLFALLSNEALTNIPLSHFVSL